MTESFRLKFVFDLGRECFIVYFSETHHLSKNAVTLFGRSTGGKHGSGGRSCAKVVPFPGKSRLADTVLQM